jgi:recombination protein RecT
MENNMSSNLAVNAEKFPQMLKDFLPEIQRALPQHLNGDRMARIALTAFRRTPKLAECSPVSVFAAVIQASQLGLEPDTLGRAFLVPYKGECQFVPGWKGLVDLLNRSGQGTAWTGAVFEGDEFDYRLGDAPFVSHKPMGESEKITHVYAIGRQKGSDYPVIEVWKIERVIKHRDRYNKQGDKHYSYKNMEMYARKVVLLQVLKYMPASPELAQAIALNDAAEVGSQKLSVDDAIAGTWQPVAADEAERPEARPGPEPYPDAKLTEMMPTYAKLVLNRTKTPSDIIKTIRSKYTLTAEQENKINALDINYSQAAKPNAASASGAKTDEWGEAYDKKAAENQPR